MLLALTSAKPLAWFPIVSCCKLVRYGLERQAMNCVEKKQLLNWSQRHYQQHHVQPVADYQWCPSCVNMEPLLVNVLQPGKKWAWGSRRGSRTRPQGTQGERWQTQVATWEKPTECQEMKFQGEGGLRLEQVAQRGSGVVTLL